MAGCFHVEHVMGTAVTIDGREADNGGVPAVVAWLHHVDRTFSTYRDDSAITMLARGQLDVDALSPEVRDVLVQCEELRLSTDGAFDAFAVPAPNGTTLDPSGFVKGWAVQAAAVILEEHGHRNFSINAGGDVAVRGRPAPGNTWNVGIRNPHDPSTVVAVLGLDGAAGVATSGTYERGDHIVDPFTQYRATQLASVTVVGPDLGTADAYATAVFVMGVEGLRWLTERPGYDAFVLTNDRRAFATPGMPLR